MRKKKIFIGVLIFLAVAVGLALLSPDEDNEQNEPDTAPVTVSDSNSVVNEDEDVAANESGLANPYEGRKAEIYDIVLNRIESGDYLNTTITEIKLNDNMGDPADGDFILLVYGSFDIRNSKDTGNNVMKMYANDLMASVAGEGVTEIAEGVVFWKDDHNNRTVKYAYEYKDGNFYIADVIGE